MLSVRYSDLRLGPGLTPGFDLRRVHMYIVAGWRCSQGVPSCPTLSVSRDQQGALKACYPLVVQRACSLGCNMTWLREPSFQTEMLPPGLCNGA